MRNRPWIALIFAAVASAGVGWFTYDRIEKLEPSAAVLDTVAQGFWLLALFFGVLGVGTITGRYVSAVMRRGAEKQISITQLGQYTLGVKLGEGAMGSVYRAQHALLRRPTAVKLLRPERQRDLRAQSRFEREVQQTARLMHHNTVAVYDYGHDADGVFYYAMEFIEGVTFETLVRERGPLPAPRVIYILVQICGSLIEAHGVGLIHRDLKPANIMLCEQGGEHDVAKVLDFGLVKDTSEAGSNLTATQALAGTPLYASPEAIRGSDDVEPRSDLYSLGAVAYFLLTGERVFDGETIMQVCTQHLSEAPVPPSARTDLEIPEDLEAIIMSCLAKDPDDRPADAQALRKALYGCVDHGGWCEPDALDWWNQHRDELPLPGRKARKQLDVAMLTMTIDLQQRTVTKE